MDDFDDYIVDDIVLDDQTLEALDRQEKQYFAEGSSVKPDEPEPANKRLKTINSWSPVPVIQKPTIVEDESLPEISLQGDGTYGLSARLNSNPVQAPYQGRQGNQFSNLNNVQSTSTLAQASSRLNTPTSVPKPASSRLMPPQRSRQVVPSPSRASTSTPKHGGQITTSGNLGPGQLQKALDEIAQLRADYARLQAQLKETQDARIMREGEVGVLRRSIEKTNQMHTAHLAQLRQEKEKAEAKQAEMQKEVKQEIERLRTQFMFKQQELEATIRKPPGTLRAKRINKELSATPAFASTQLDSTNRHLFPDATPMRAVRPMGNSPTKTKAMSPQKTMKPGTLPGFHNAFDTSTPIRSQMRRINKEKERQNEDVNMDDTFYPEIQPLRFSPVPSHSRAPPASSADLAPFSMPPTDNMAGTPQQLDSDEEVIPDLPFEGINWKALMAHFFLTYSHPCSEIYLFQRLLSVAQTVNSALYTKCCSQIMEVIASPMDVTNFKGSLKVVCSSLLTLIVLLNDANELQLLASVLNLNAKLILSIPGFVSALSASMAQGEEVDIVTIICKLVTSRLQHDSSHQDNDMLAREMFLLLESLVIRASPENSESVKAIPQNRECMMVLLHLSQPVWFLERAARFLCVLSYHHSIYNDVLNVNVPDAGQDTLIREGLIDLLCSHLVDSFKSVRQDNKDLRIYILTFFTQLSITHTDARAVLVMSHSLIPSIIIYLAQLTAPLWEDDQKLMDSPEETISLIRTTNQATLLLHNLVFDGATAIDLRHRLQDVKTRFSSSIFHTFILTFGRLSYCNPPSWIGAEGKQDFEHICELSRDILEIVVDGPEVDNVWATFQIENGGDDEDMEETFLSDGN